MMEKETKKEKLIAWMKRQRNSSHLIRIIAGGYVAYLGACVFADYFKGEADAGIGLILCAALILLAGAAIAVVSLYAYLNGYSVEFGGRKPWETPEEEEPEELEEASETGEE